MKGHILKRIDAKSVIIGLLSGVCIVLLMGQSTESDKKVIGLESDVHDVIKAKKIMMVDDKGNPRISLFNDENGGVMIIANKEGETTFGFRNTMNGGQMEIANKAGIRAIKTTTIRLAAPAIIIYGAADRFSKCASHKYRNVCRHAIRHN